MEAIMILNKQLTIKDPYPKSFPQMGQGLGGCWD